MQLPDAFYKEERLVVVGEHMWHSLSAGDNGHTPKDDTYSKPLV
jgi:hypothetical protein